MVAAVERHSTRYGVPGAIYVDNGTQLVSMASAKFTPQDLENELRDKVDVKVVVI